MILNLRLRQRKDGGARKCTTHFMIEKNKKINIKGGES